MRLEPVIGFEVHAQLATLTKIFCSCANEIGGAPNTRTCPVCLGLPGALPALNGEVVDLAVTAALALGARVSPRSGFARKNYFYPDLPKGYQITQFAEPIATDGVFEFASGGTRSRVRIRQVHIEEDAGKSVHEEDGESGASLVDMNRCGVPLVEIVTRPDLRSVGEADAFLTELRSLLVYLGVATGRMHEGSLRFDTNVSVRPAGEESFGTQTEIKNLNSFRAVRKALEYEIDRQSRVVEAGGSVRHETMLWDEVSEKAVSMRSKEGASDYRYFPEPDLVDFTIDDERVGFLRRSMPDTPAELRSRLTSEDWYALSTYDAGVLTADPDSAVYFEEVLAKVLALLGVLPEGTELLDWDSELLTIDIRQREKLSVVLKSLPELGVAELPRVAKTVSNWVTVHVRRWLNEHPEEDMRSFVGLGLSSSRLAEVVARRLDGTLSEPAARVLLEAAIESPEPVDELVDRLELTAVSDDDALRTVVGTVLAEHPSEVERYRAGTVKLLRFFVGRVLEAAGGKADPEAVAAILKEELGNGGGT